MAPSLRTFLLYLATWPYYGTLRKHTLSPVRRIAREQPDAKTLCDLVLIFTNGKRHEINYINLASALVASLTVGMVGWPAVSDAHWSVAALLYTSLILSLFSIIIGAQQTFLLDLVPSEPIDYDEMTTEVRNNIIIFAQALFRNQRPKLVSFFRGNGMHLGTRADIQNVLRERDPSAIMIWMWQSPLMDVAWAWVALLVALTIYIARPFMVVNEVDADKKIAIMFFVLTGITVVNFFVCSMCAMVTARGAQDLPFIRKPLSFSGPSAIRPSAHSSAYRGKLPNSSISPAATDHWNEVSQELSTAGP